MGTQVISESMSCVPFSSRDRNRKGGCQTAEPIIEREYKIRTCYFPESRIARAGFLHKASDGRQCCAGRCAVAP